MLSRRTFLGILSCLPFAGKAAAAAEPITATAPFTYVLDVNDITPPAADHASYIYGVRRKGEMTFTMNWEPNDQSGLGSL